MPDITMCKNEDCPLSWNCWRFNAPKDKHAQAYAMFEYYDDNGCNYYWPMDDERTDLYKKGVDN